MFFLWGHCSSQHEIHRRMARSSPGWAPIAMPLPLPSYAKLIKCQDPPVNSVILKSFCCKCIAYNGLYRWFIDPWNSGLSELSNPTTCGSALSHVEAHQTKILGQNVSDIGKERKLLRQNVSDIKSKLPNNSCLASSILWCCCILTEN